jgi:hypothetical protein
MAHSDRRGDGGPSLREFRGIDQERNHSREAQVAGPSLRGGSPRLDGSARPGVPLSQGSRLRPSARAPWRRNGFSGSGRGRGAPRWHFAQTCQISRPVRARRPRSPGLRGSSSGLTHWRPPPSGCLLQPALVTPVPPTPRGLTANGLPTSGAGYELGASRGAARAKPLGAVSRRGLTAYDGGATVSAGEPEDLVELRGEAAHERERGEVTVERAPGAATGGFHHLLHASTHFASKSCASAAVFPHSGRCGSQKSRRPWQHWMQRSWLQAGLLDG